MILLTFALDLFHRLEDGQQVLDATDDVFVKERVGNLQSAIDDVDGIVTGLGTVVSAEETSIAPEVPQLVGFLAGALDLPPQEVLAILQENFPHVAGLLAAAPVSTEGVREAQELVAFLADALGITQEQLLAAVQTNFPNIAILLGAALPPPEGGTPFVARWDAATTSGPEGQMTFFDGRPVTSIPLFVDFVDDDVTPRLTDHADDFRDLDDFPPGVRFFPWFFVGVGGILIVLGATMFLISGPRSGE